MTVIPFMLDVTGCRFPFESNQKDISIVFDKGLTCRLIDGVLFPNETGTPKSKRIGVWGRGGNEVGGNLLKKKSVWNNLIQFFFFFFHSCIETNKAIVYSINFQKNSQICSAANRD